MLQLRVVTTTTTTTTTKMLQLRVVTTTTYNIVIVAKFHNTTLSQCSRSQQ